jgi:hypothetical protein
MFRFMTTAVLLIVLASNAQSAHYFASISEVDAAKGVVTYTHTRGKDKGTIFKAPVGKNCVIKEGAYFLGKPAGTKEGDDVAEGLKNAKFKNATAEQPLTVDIFTADADDEEKGIKAGDIVKILVNPAPKKKP